MAFEFGSSRVTATPSLALPLSFGCWFRKGTTDDLVMTVGATSGTSATLSLRGDGGAVGRPLKAMQNGSTVATTSNGFNGSTWHHGFIVATSVSDISVFCDGAGKANGGSGATITPTQVSIPSNTNGNTLQVAEAAIWSVALTDAEVAVLARGFSPLLVRPQSLVFYTPLVRDAIDFKGASLTLTGGPTAFAHPRVYFPSRPRISVPEASAEIAVSAINTLALSQQAALSQLNLIAQNAISFSQSSYPPEVVALATNTLSLIQGQQQNNNAMSSLLLDHSAFTPEVSRQLEQTIRIRQTLRVQIGNIASGRYRR
jgi:uncharacterized Zn-finger protein